MTALAVPEILHHQGRVSVDGVNFDGTGQFKFLIYSRPNASSPGINEVALWRNDDEEPSNMGIPTDSVAEAVAKGLYSTALGGAGMAPLPASLETAANATAYLRVWFNDGVNGFQQLTPDQPLRSVPYALHAKTASSISSSANFQTGSVTTGSLSLGSGAGSVLLQLSAPGSGSMNLGGDLLVAGTGKSGFAGDVTIDGGFTAGYFTNSVLPATGSAFDLGSPSARWARLFLGPQGINFGAGATQASLTFDPANERLVVSSNLEVASALNADEMSSAGDVTASGDFKFATTKAGKLQVGASAFRPEFSTPDGYLVGADYFFPASGAPLDGGSSVYRLGAPVQLPHGAVVTKVDFFVFDEEGGPTLNSFTGKLTSKSMTPPVPASATAIATAQSTFPIASVQSTTTITPATISRDNAYALDVRFLTNGNTQSIGFLGATIHYTINSVQP